MGILTTSDRNITCKRIIEIQYLQNIFLFSKFIKLFATQFRTCELPVYVCHLIGKSSYIHYHLRRGSGGAGPGTRMDHRVGSPRDLVLGQSGIYADGGVLYGRHLGVDIVPSLSESGDLWVYYDPCPPVSEGLTLLSH